MSAGVHSAKYVMHSSTISILQNILLVVDYADDICSRKSTLQRWVGGGTGAVMKSAHISALGLLIIVFYLARCSTTYCTVQVHYCTMFWNIVEYCTILWIMENIVEYCTILCIGTVECIALHCAACFVMHCIVMHGDPIQDIAAHLFCKYLQREESNSLDFDTLHTSPIKSVLQPRQTWLKLALY